MLLSDFDPYIAPYVIGCPQPTIHHHVRLAAIDFCRRTHCHIRTLEPVQGFDGTTFELEPDKNMQIVKVLLVMVDGRTWPMVTADKAYGLLSSDCTQDFCFTEDGQTINVHPKQPSTAKLTVRAASAPSISATVISDDLKPYIEDIANGAIARIMHLPSQPFSNPNSATMHDALYLDRVRTIGAKVSRGMLSAHISGRARFY